MAELILSGDTLDQGRIKINNFFTTATTEINIWSSSTGSTSVIVNNGTGNLASGDYSFVGGKTNTASGTYSSVLNGKLNKSSGTYSSILNGSGNTASGTYSIILNGQSNISASAFSAIAAGATTGPQTTLGSYAGTFSSLFNAGSNSGGATIAFTATSTGAATKIATTSSWVSNADYATQILTAALTTVTTAQSTISAGAVGLEAQLKNVIALKNGLTNTVNAISNVDATAMQAKLQKLNNQQSIDYYLVSQMNTEASAILTIFR